jgi:DNA-binding beta-propeller fold protein YncE
MKKRLGCALLLLVVVVVLPNRVPSAAQDASGQAGAKGAPPMVNPLKLALLRWYKANTVYTMFPVGKEPIGIAFDGANIWTANWSDGTVTKLQANDGTVLGTFPSGGAEPYGVTFDGANIWAPSEGSNSVTTIPVY